MRNAPAATCASSYSTTNLADGVHRLMVTANYQTGTPSTITYQWTVDTAPPVVTISQMPPVVTSAATATFSFSALDVTSSVTLIECSLDHAPMAPCTASVAYSALGAGSHEFDVRATDQAGNISVPIAYTWLVDPNTPNLTLTATPTAATNQTTAQFSFSGVDPDGNTVAQFNLHA